MNVQSVQVSPYADRLVIWQEAIDATRRHLQFAKAFQNAGKKIVLRLQESPDEGTPEDISRCLIALERGTKMERDAYRELIELHNLQPRET